MRPAPIVAAVAALALCLAAPASAQQQITLLPLKDTSIYESNTANGGGRAPDLYAGNNRSGSTRRALVAFDLSAVPEGVTVTSAEVTFRVAQFSSGAAGRIALHPLLADWGEGSADPGSRGGQGAPESGDGATWSDAFNGTAPWSSPGGDFLASASASVQLDRGQTDYTLATDQLLADVQGWLGAPASNFGWMVRGDESANQSVVKLDSRDRTGLPMQLVLTYTNATSAARAEQPAPLTLSGAFPSPARATTTLRYTLGAPAAVRIAVYDALGREVLRPGVAYRGAGEHALALELSALPSSLYLYVVEAGEHRATGRFVRTR
jgi:hypothetical protein